MPLNKDELAEEIYKKLIEMMSLMQMLDNKFAFLEERVNITEKLIKELTNAKKT